MPFLGAAPATPPDPAARDALIDRIKSAVLESSAIQATLNASADPSQNTPAQQAQAVASAQSAHDTSQAILAEHDIHVRTMSDIATATAAAQATLAKLQGHS